MITSEEIKKRLWDGANDLRGSMDASRYKDYMLGLMFYKFLSDKTLEAYRTTAGLSLEEDIYDSYVKDYASLEVKLEAMIQKILGYFVKPEYLYQTWTRDIKSGDFEVQKVTDSLSEFERTIAVAEDNDDFKGLFSSSTLDLSDTALGSNLNERSKNIRSLILLFEDLDMVALQKGDVLGDAYEYLIGQFAMESGKKAGEFYTPRQVSEVMAQIIAKDKDIESIYDPTVGSGSLLLTVKKHLPTTVQRDLNYYGQEKNTATYNLTRMNLLLHGVKPDKMSIKNGDTLSQDWPEDPERPNEGVQFDAVVMNPPYSVKNWNRYELKVSDPRFESAGVLPPDSKGDFAFLLQGLYHLSQNGTMAIVLPHGVLFRGGAEGEIRKRLLEKNQIDTIIGLPNNLFTNTGIPVCVLILKKNRALNEPVLFIDASHNFIKVGKQNVLQEKDIAKIVDTYSQKVEEKGYSHLASRQELIKNDYNMNIPRFVESLDDDIPQDVDGHLYGGIPVKNIEELTILNNMVKDTLYDSLGEVRPGYVKLIKTLSELTEDVLNDHRITNLSKDLKVDIEAYIAKYWNVLHQQIAVDDIVTVREDMLSDIKSLLKQYDLVDTYGGYQIIAEIWKSSLTHDIELISKLGFYEAGRSREKNMITKGKHKELIQDGWNGALIPNDLIAEQLFSEEHSIIESHNTRLNEIESELTELVEDAKVEDSDTYNALFDVLKKSEDGEPLDSFEDKLVKAELKEQSKESDSYRYLRKVDDLTKEKKAINKAIKTSEQTLKEAVANKIPELTNDEIDHLVSIKWFGSVNEQMTELVKDPIKSELATLDLLNNRYSQTLTDIDQEISELEKSLEELMNELVV